MVAQSKPSASDGGLCPTTLAQAIAMGRCIAHGVPIVLAHWPIAVPLFQASCVSRQKPLSAGCVAGRHKANRLLVTELNTPLKHPPPDYTTAVPYSGLSIQNRERAMAQHLEANRQLFQTCHIWSVSTDAVRAGFLNRQNIAAFTVGGVDTWRATSDKGHFPQEPRV